MLLFSILYLLLLSMEIKCKQILVLLVALDIFEVPLFNFCRIVLTIVSFLKVHSQLLIFYEISNWSLYLTMAKNRILILFPLLCFVRVELTKVETDKFHSKYSAVKENLHCWTKVIVAESKTSGLKGSNSISRILHNSLVNKSIAWWTLWHIYRSLNPCNHSCWAELCGNWSSISYEIPKELCLDVDSGMI